MQLPGSNASSEVYLDHTDHFEGAAEAWADAELITAAQTKAVAEANAVVAGAAARLRESVAVSDTAARAATKARAHYNVRDVVLDLRVMSLSDVLLNVLCGRSYTHAIYKHVFSDGAAGDITGARIREEPELAEAMLTRYSGVDEFPGKAAAGDLLKGAVAKSLGSRDGVDAAERAENTAGGQELFARLGVRNALDQAYGVLRAAVPGQRAFVESFFYKRAPSKGDKSEAASGETPPAGPGANP
jgi:hypothetical protein